MLQGQRQNVHHSKLPSPGAVGRIGGLSMVSPRRKCIVIAFPLTDSPDSHHAVGIHTCFVRFLDDGEISRFSGVWFSPLD